MGLGLGGWGATPVGRAAVRPVCACCVERRQGLCAQGLCVRFAASERPLTACCCVVRRGRIPAALKRCERGVAAVADPATGGLVLAIPLRPFAVLVQVHFLPPHDPHRPNLRGTKVCEEHSGPRARPGWAQGQA